MFLHYGFLVTRKVRQINCFKEDSEVHVDCETIPFLKDVDEVLKYSLFYLI